jgi:high-affinity iron transporter
MLLLLAPPALASASDPTFAARAALPAASQQDAAALAQGLRALNDFAALAQTALANGDVVAARAAYSQFDDGWEAIEDGVRDRSRDSYRSIEDAMSDADRALRNNPVDATQATALLGELQNRVNQFIATLPQS